MDKDMLENDTLYKCTVCGRIGRVGRCCGLETRIPLNDMARKEQGKGDEMTYCAKQLFAALRFCNQYPSYWYNGEDCDHDHSPFSEDDCQIPNEDMAEVICDFLNSREEVVEPTYEDEREMAEKKIAIAEDFLDSL